MYKKKQAMEQSNGAAEEPATADVLEVPVDDPLEENGHAALDAGKKHKKTRKRKATLMKFARKKSKSKKVTPPAPDDDGEYQVEAIIGHKKEKGKMLYRVRWVGYSADQDSWLSSGDLNCEGLLKKYKKKMERETKDVFNVEKIIDHRRLNGKLYYRVRWENYSAKDDTWQEKETLNCPDLLKNYHDELNKSILQREELKLKQIEEAKKSNNEYEVESIVDKKTVKGKVKYLIHWKGWDSTDDTWEPAETLHCPDLIRAFNKKLKTPSKQSKVIKKKRKNNEDSSSESDDDDDSDYGSSKKRRTKSEYEVEKVLNARLNSKGKWEFFVMWKGWTPDNNSWEPESNLNCPQMIDQFLGKDKVPRTIQAKLEKAKDKANEKEAETPKAKRKPPGERRTPAVSGLRGRTKGELKVLS